MDDKYLRKDATYENTTDLCFLDFKDVADDIFSCIMRGVLNFIYAEFNDTFFTAHLKFFILTGNQKRKYLVPLTIIISSIDSKYFVGTSSRLEQIRFHISVDLML